MNSYTQPSMYQPQMQSYQGTQQVPQMPYNPYSNNNYFQNAQARLNEMEQQYNHQQQQFQQTTQPQSNIKLVEVTGIDEVKAHNVTDGAFYIFINKTTKEIHTRQFDFTTGVALFDTYTKTENQSNTEQSKTINISERVAELESKYTNLEVKINEYANNKYLNAEEPTSEGNDATTTTNAKSRARPANNTKSDDTSKPK